MHTTDEPERGLSPEQGRALAKLARLSLMEHFGKRLPPVETDRLMRALKTEAIERRAGTFVTLKLGGRLRGCIGSLSASETLVEGIRRNALNAALHDPRFAPLSDGELDRVKIEISVLTEPRRLEHRGGADLARRLAPGADGVVIGKGMASATFLPQVWDQLPRATDFLSQLCLKAGLPAEAWKSESLEVSTYRVQHFEEQP